MGDGPLVDEVRGKAAILPQVEYLGQRSASEVLAAMAGARFLIFSSESYEPLPLTVVEAFSRGTPVLAADMESVAELVKDGMTGLRFIPGDARDLAAKTEAMVADLSRYQEMRQKCRAAYEERYTEELNYKMLTNIYAAAIESSRSCLMTRSSR
jgi:glycosyltransferase involved in cell wall biosynthesis